MFKNRTLTVLAWTPGNEQTPMLEWKNPYPPGQWYVVKEIMGMDSGAPPRFLEVSFYDNETVPGAAFTEQLICQLPPSAQWKTVVDDPVFAV